MWSFLFFANSFLLGVGLAMDAFSLSLTNGMTYPDMSRSHAFATAGTFGLFQMIMPMAGWAAIRFLADTFREIQRWTPWIALAVLCFLGIKMIIDAVRNKEETPARTTGTLIVEGITTSLDALSVGFTIYMYPWFQAAAESAIIGAVTFGICIAGVFLGKAIGVRLKNKARIIGGIILIAVGIEIFVKNWVLAG